jgi:HEAT repeat protein
MKPLAPLEVPAITPASNPSTRARPAGPRKARPVRKPSMMHPNTAQVIRRVLVAALTGSLPDEYRDEAVNLLLEALCAPDDDVRGLAVIALNEIAPRSPVVLPALTDALNDSSETVRRRAARALGDLGPGALPALPYLAAGLQDDSLGIRLECAAALGRIGPDAEPALPSLFVLLLEPDLRVRTLAASSIRHVGPAAVNYALAMLADSEPIMRERACELLGRMGCLDDFVVESLLEACTDSEPEVREAARNALDRLQQQR